MPTEEQIAQADRAEIENLASDNRRLQGENNQLRETVDRQAECIADYQERLDRVKDAVNKA